MPLVIPAKAGIHLFSTMDSRLRGNDNPCGKDNAGNNRLCG